MKNALAMYIDGLAAIAARTGKLPKGAGSAKALRPLWESLREDMALALEARMTAAVVAEIAGSSPKARAALDAAGFGPIPEAAEKLGRKNVVASGLRSADWALAPVEIREAAQFSAGVASARVMGAIQERLRSDLGWELGKPSGREAFLRDMRAVMQAEGVGSAVTGEGSLTNPQSNSRLGLIYDQQTTSARGYAAHKMAMDPDALAAVPAQELVREAEPKGGASARRDWPAIWKAKGGKLAGGRMAALKTDGIWTAISRFGVPWPPYDYGSHMGLRDLLRPEAVALGLLKEDDPDPLPDEAPFAGGLRASAEGVPDEMRDWLKQAFGDRIEFEGDAARWASARASTQAEADAWGLAALRGEKIPLQGREALLAYQNRDTHAQVNAALRDGVGNADADRMAKAIDLARTHEPALVWRAEDAGYMGPGGIAQYIGKTKAKPAFTSTAFSRAAAEKGYAEDVKNPILYEIYVPKGARALSINAATGGKSRNAHETELLLQRGAKIYVRRLERTTLPDGREAVLVKAEVMP